MLSVGQKVEITIEKLVHGGSGLARFQDFVIFCDYTSPGETIIAQIKKVKKNFANAEKIQSLSPGPKQRQAICPQFGVCGACQWQNTQYDEQIKQKRQIIWEQIGSLIPQEFDFTTSPEWYYRNRAQVRVKGDHIGFFKKGSHEIISIKDCSILEKDILEAALKLPPSPKKISKYEIYKDSNQQIHFSLNKKHAEESGFSQINSIINQALLNTSVEWLQLEATGQVYDLFCGQGNFSRHIHRFLPNLKITGIDINPANIKIAKQQGSQIDYITSDVNIWLKNNKFSSDATIIIDPPRTGSSKDFVSLLAKQKFQQILYVSCDISTFKRDILTLQKLRPELYIKKFQAFDMFPQTFHFETAALISSI